MCNSLMPILSAEMDPTRENFPNPQQLTYGLKVIRILIGVHFQTFLKY